MVFELDEVVPWGRSFNEYVAMFDLSEEDLGRQILGCGDGPADFNAELTVRGGTVVSVDPIYRFSAGAIRGRIEETFPLVLEQARSNAHQFVWESIPTVEELGRVRTEAMEHFLADYPTGRMQGRYLAAALPDLPFSSGRFGLALCSHLLFLYSNHLGEDAHVRSIVEMCRVAGEARIFPLLDLNAKRSRHLGPVTDRLESMGHQVEVVRVPYEFQRGGRDMLRVTRPVEGA